MISSSDVLVSPHREDIPKCRKEESRGFFLSKKCVFISLNLFRSVISLLIFIFWMIWYVLSALKAASVKGFKSLRVVEKLPESPAMCLRSSQQFWSRVFKSWGSSDSSSYLGFCKLVCTLDELHERHFAFDTVRAVQVCTVKVGLTKLELVKLRRILRNSFSHLCHGEKIGTETNLFWPIFFLIFASSSEIRFSFKSQWQAGVLGWRGKLFSTYMCHHHPFCWYIVVQICVAAMSHDP